MYYDPSCKPVTIPLLPKPKLEPWRQALLDCVDYLRKHGWCQHVLHACDGSVCLLGAINIITARAGKDESTSIYNSCISTVLAEVRRRTHRPFDIVCWNDTRGRTVEEVIDLLEAVARKP